MMQALGGALFYGGIYDLVVGYSRLVGLLKKIVTPVVIGPTIMLIGFGLAGTAVSTASSNWIVSLSGVALIFVSALIIKNKTLNAFPVFLSMITLYLVAVLGTVVGWFPAGNSMHVNFQAISGAPGIVWPTLLRYGTIGQTLKFNTLALTAIVAAYTSSIIESIGDYHSISYASGLEDPSAKTISMGIGAEGLDCIISGMMGGVGTTGYTENIGIVALTGTASRRVIRTGAAILIVLGFLWKFGTIIGTIPSPIIGAAYLSLFSLIGGTWTPSVYWCRRNIQEKPLDFRFCIHSWPWTSRGYSTACDCLRQRRMACGHFQRSSQERYGCWWHYCWYSGQPHSRNGQGKGYWSKRLGYVFR